MARILFTIDYDTGTQKANLVPQVLRLDPNDQVEFQTQVPGLAIKFKQDYPQAKLKAGQLYDVPQHHLTAHFAAETELPFQCGKNINGTFTPYKGGGEAPGGSSGGD